MRNLSKAQTLSSTLVIALLLVGAATAPGAAGQSLAAPQAGQWQVLTPATAPAARYGHSLVTLSVDAPNDTPVLFGGMAVSGTLALGDDMYIFGGGNPVPQNDLWVYDDYAQMWSEIIAPNPPTPRAHHSAVADGDKMYVFGGTDGLVPRADLWVYEDQGQAWAEIIVPNPPTPRSHHAAAMLAGKMYILSGQDGDDFPLGDLWVYDPTANTWTQRADYPGGANQAYGAPLGVSDGKLRVLPLDALPYQYDPTTSTWTPLEAATDPPSARLEAASAQTSDGNLYLAGGDALATPLADAYVYDPVANAWTQVADMPQPWFSAEMTAYNSPTLGGEGLLLFGGYTGSLPNFTLGDQTYFLLTNPSDHWQPLNPPDPPTARAGHSLVSVAGTPYLFGGTDGLVPRADLWVYEDQNQAWAETIAPNPPTPRAYHSAAAIGDEMYVFGGTDGVVPQQDIWVYDDQGQIWSQIIPPNPPPARSHHAAVTVGDQMLVAGGQDAADQPLDDVYLYDPTANTWTRRADFPGGSQRAAAANLAGDDLVDASLAVYGNRVYVLNLGSPVYIFNVAANTWSSVAIDPAPTARVAAGVAYDGSRAWLWGGEDILTTAPLTDAWEFDFANRTWTQVAEMPASRVGAAGTFVPGGAAQRVQSADDAGWVLAFGGLDAAAAPQNTTYAYYPPAAAPAPPEYHIFLPLVVRQ